MLKKLIACAILTAAAPAALAANNVDLKVSGNIAPVACDISLGGGGVFDYGNISPDLLTASDYTKLPVKETALQIKCEAPIKIGIKTSSRRPGTAVGGTKYANGASWIRNLGLLKQNTYHGLGLSDGKPVGGYAMILEPSSMSADGAKVQAITREHDAPWVKENAGSFVYVYNNFWQSWSDPAKLEPLPITQFNAILKVQAYIDHKENLDFSKAIKLDGMSAIELTYL